MALQFNWEEVWAYHEAIEDEVIKAALEEEVVGSGWLYRQTLKVQRSVLTHAPIEFVKKIASNLKPEIQIEMGLNPFSRR